MIKTATSFFNMYFAFVTKPAPTGLESNVGSALAYAGATRKNKESEHSRAPGRCTGMKTHFRNGNFMLGVKTTYLPLNSMECVADSLFGLWKA